MKTCYIFAGAPMAQLPPLTLAEDRLILCADGGYTYAKRLGIAPDCLVGDFDTLQGPLPEDVEIVRHPVQKDDTDSMLAVKLGLARGCRSFVLYGAIGGRLDHTLANVQALLYLRQHGAEGKLIGASDTALLHPPGTRTYAAEDGAYFSVLALADPCIGVTLRGVEYPLTEATLTPSFPLGVSNHIVAETASVSLTSGLLLLVFSKDSHQIPPKA